MTVANRSLSTLDGLAIVIVVLVWGLNFIPMKFGLRDFTPFQLGAARFLFAAVPMIFWVRPPRIGYGWLTAYAMVQGVGQFGFLFFALKVGMTAALASVLMQTQVFFTALLGWAVLKERIGRPLITGMTLAGAGLICFAFSIFRHDGSDALTMAGLALTLMAACMWAGSSIIVKMIQANEASFSPLSLIVWSSLVSAVSFAIISVVFDPESARWKWVNASVTGWLSVAYLGWGANILGYGLWTNLLHRHPSSRIAPFSLGMPVVGLLAGMLVLDEQVDALQWVGALFVMSALVFVVRDLSAKTRVVREAAPPRRE